MTASEPGASRSPGTPRRPGVGLLAALIWLAVASSLWSPAFDGYDADLWTYALIVERTAKGDDMLAVEPFAHEPPASPHVSAVWITLGWLKKATGAATPSLMRGAGLLSAALLTFAAWNLSRKLLSRDLLAVLATLLFWLAFPESWAGVALGRFTSLGFVLLASSACLALGRRRYAWVATGLFVALAFYTHLFGGVLALAAVFIVSVARLATGEAPPVRAVARAVGVGLLLSTPCLLYAYQTAGLPRASAHEWRPELVEWLGLRWLPPEELVRLVPAAVGLLAVAGWLAPVPPPLRLARSVARLGAIAVLGVLCTPLHHLALKLFGAWMVGRTVALAFPWLAACLGACWLCRHGRAQPVRAVGALLVVAAVAQGVGRAASDWTDDRYTFAREAQREAAALRPWLNDRWFVSLDLLGYALATPTLGLPLAVPPGHASPFGDFRRRHRRAHRALATNTPECWNALFTLHPDTAFLLTPQPEAKVESGLWNGRFPQTPSASVRSTLRDMGVLEPVQSGRFFVLDAIHPKPPVEPHRGAAGMGMGPLCTEP